MIGLAGVQRPDARQTVESMLAQLAHRGRGKIGMETTPAATCGFICADESDWALFPDCPGDRLPTPAQLRTEPRPFALARALPDGLFLARDRVGVRPLYYGYTPQHELYCASEVKALLGRVQSVHEFPPGAAWLPGGSIQSFAAIQTAEERPPDADTLAAELRANLEQAVARAIRGDSMGSWLSGGLDSSVIVALVRPHVRTLHTFAGGLDGAPDLAAAKQVAEALGTHHHEVRLSEADLLRALPDVITALESFDALLVRSSIVNYLVAREAARHVDAIFSGEGADELFAGYAYLQDVPEAQLNGELVDIIRRLHNTAMQRVDRCASAHGLTAHVPFVDGAVLDLALQIPAALKHRRTQNPPVEKWILRHSMQGMLPESILWRPKAKFWEGAGVGERLRRHAETVISEAEFHAGQRLPDGSRIHSREEMLYYRIFKEQFGELDDLSWMGRTKGAPEEQ